MSASDKLARLGGGTVVIGFVWALPGWLLFSLGGWPCVVVFAAHLLVGALVSHWVNEK